MKAMILKRLGMMSENPEPLELADVPVPVPGPGEVLVRVSVCGVCHTELDEIEGRTAPPHLPVVLGHQVVGSVEEAGRAVHSHKVGDRVGIGWIYSSCGKCDFCLRGDENLCAEFKATGRDVNGGYAEFITVPAESAYPIPREFSDSQAAPLLCAGAIGYRSLRLTGISDGERLGLFGFGASAHIVLQLARYLYPRTGVYVFARSEEERRFALELGAAWAGDFGPEVNTKTQSDREAGTRNQTQRAPSSPRFGPTQDPKSKIQNPRNPDSTTRCASSSETPRLQVTEDGGINTKSTKNTKGSDSDLVPSTPNPAPLLHAAIDTTPVWRPVLSALERLAPGGRLVVNAIRKEDADMEVLLSLDYPKHLWLEKEVKSVANVTRRDIAEFLPLAAKAGIRPEVTGYRLEDANRALRELRERGTRGAKVLRVEQDEVRS